MKLKKVTIENYRAIERMELPLHPQLTVLHGDNGHGKTSVLNGVAVGLSRIPQLLVRGPRGSLTISDSDQRRSGPLRVTTTTTEGLRWTQGSSLKGRAPQALREKIADIVAADSDGRAPLDLPILALYDTDRALVREPYRLSSASSSRYDALGGAFSARSDFRRFFEWFYERENVEIRSQRELRDFDYRLRDLDAVRRAVGEMVPGLSRPSMESNLQTGSGEISFHFTVSMTDENGNSETLDIDQLSGGYRIVLAMVADLARRMAQGNPHLEDALGSEAIVLIDEVDLHLHPRWQQRVLTDLMDTFPNAQFIVSTHSPQVLTTVKPEHIVELYREGDGVVAGGASGHTYGAKSGDVLAVLMGVDERPPSEHNEFVAVLERYNELVFSGQGESAQAKGLRSELESLSPRDPGLGRADAEMRRQKVMSRLAEAKPKEETQ